MSEARLIDTGLRNARWNLAMTAALAASQRPRVGDITLRLQRFPSSVLIGRHQRLEAAVRPERCRQSGVEIARRPTGGGAVYMAQASLAWDVIADRQRFAGRLDTAAAAIGQGAARGLARLGAAAEFAAPGDIRVEQRKLCGTSGYIDGDALVLQGTVLIEFDPAPMAAVLVLPHSEAAALGSRLIGLGEILGRMPDAGEVESALAAGIGASLGVDFVPGLPRAQEIALADRLYATEFGRDAFVAGEELV